MKSWDMTKTLLGATFLAIGVLTGPEASAERLIAGLLADPLSWPAGQVILGGTIIVKGAAIVSARPLGGNRITITNSGKESVLILTPVSIRGVMPTRAHQLESLREWLELETVAMAPTACDGSNCAVEISGDVILVQLSGGNGIGDPETSRTVRLLASDFVLTRPPVAQ